MRSSWVFALSVICSLVVLLGLPLARAAEEAKPSAPTAPETVKDGPRPGRPATFKRGVCISHWLSQLLDEEDPETSYASPRYFNEKDVAWIAEHGYDHIRFPIDIRLALDKKGRVDFKQLKAFDDALGWCRARGLGVIFDMHYLPGAAFDEEDAGRKLFTSPKLHAQAKQIWHDVAEKYRDVGDLLRFELLNEPNARQAGQVNDLFAELLPVVRAISPQRVCYLTSNEWSIFPTAPQVRLVDDPYVAYTFHYYEPYLFTHQQAWWSEVGEKYKKQVPYPGTVTGLAKYFGKDHWIVDSFEGKEMKPSQVADDFAGLAALFAKSKAEVYIGEFGCFEGASDASATLWIKTVRDQAEQRGWGWAVWDYKGDFGVTKGKRVATRTHDALMSPKPAVAAATKEK